jgi:S1-C subfamily serine protease
VNGRVNVARIATLAAVSLLGGLVALGGAALSGDLGGGTTTVVRTSPAPTATARVADDDARVASGTALSVREIYRRAAPGVVQITSTDTTLQDTPSLSPGFGLPQAPSQQALGSGFVIDKAGHIVTNYHVIEGADQIEVSFSNQDTLRARLVGSDPSTDIAVLRVEASSRSLTPLALGNSGLVQVGDPVVAIGNPFGLARTTTAGIVSAVQERTITAPNGYPIDHVIQTDAQINSGNSGGPLLNDRAEVIGVNSQIAPAQGSSGNVGIGFAVPSNTVKDVVAQLVATGRVDRAYLGIGGSTVTEEIARVFRLPVDAGVLVEVVGEGTAAAEAGLKPGNRPTVLAGEGYTLGGDLIVAVAGKRVASLEELRDALADHEPGEQVELQIYRGSRAMTLDVTLGRQPTTPGG